MADGWDEPRSRSQEASTHLALFLPTHSYPSSYLIVLALLFLSPSQVLPGSPLPNFLAAPTSRPLSPGLFLISQDLCLPKLLCYTFLLLVFPTLGADSDSDSDLSLEEERSLSIPSSESEDNGRTRGRFQRPLRRAAQSERLLTHPKGDGNSLIS